MKLKSDSVIFAVVDDLSLDNHEYLTYIQSLELQSSINRNFQKSVGSSLSDQVMFVNPEIVLNISYLYRTDFFNEKMFKFFIRNNRVDAKSILWNMVTNSSIKSAFLIFSEKEGSSIISDILYPTGGFNENMIGIYLENLFINSYSFSFSIGKIPSVNVSLSVDDLKISNISKQATTFYVNKLASARLKLLKEKVNNLYYRTSSETQNFTSSLLNLKNISIINNKINETQAPVIDLTNFLSGNITDLNISIDFGRNKFYFFEKGNKATNREFILPCKGSLEFSGISANFTKKQLDDFTKNDKKFSLELTVGVEKGDFDYAVIMISNIILEDFSYSIDINNFITYSVKCLFEINETGGFIIDQYQIQGNLNIPNSAFSSEGVVLKVAETNQTITFI